MNRSRNCAMRQAGARPLRRPLTLAALFLLLALFSLLPAAEPRARPNILFIAADDLGNVIGSADHPLVRTPHLDRLARTGVHFTRAYNQIPLCNPSRASLLTGLRPDMIGVYDLERHFRSAVPDAMTLPQAFRRAGWWAARIGKIFHYDVPAQIGTAGLDDPPSWDATINPKGRDIADERLIANPTPGKPISAALSWLAADGDDTEQTDGMIATEAIRLMGEQRDRPFFLGVGFFRPHTPFVAPRKYFDLYPLEKIRLPRAPARDRADIPPIAFAHNNPTPNYGLDEATCRRALQAYYACVSFLDAQTGAVNGVLKIDSESIEGSVADGEGFYYTALRDKDKVLKIDARARKVVGEWSIGKHVKPNSVAYDRANQRVFVTTRGSDAALLVFDRDGKIVADTPIGLNNDSIVFDPETKKIYTANGWDGTLVIIQQVDANTYKLSEAPTTRPWARTMALEGVAMEMRPVPTSRRRPSWPAA